MLLSLDRIGSWQVSTFLRKHLVLMLLLLVFLAGFQLRLFKLGEIPYGGLVDEINFGYIAYSLLETGADEHGRSWPLIFTAFGDLKLPAYGYALLPFVWLFGLSLEIVRLPSAVFGSLSIVLAYTLIRSLGFSRWQGLGAAAIVAFSPWTFFLSRIGFESNVGLTLWFGALIGIVLLPKLQKWWHFFLVGVVAALPWYAYIAYRPVTLIVLGIYLLMLAFSRTVVIRNLALVACGFLLIIAPLLLPGMSGANTARFKQIGITSDIGVVLSVNEQRTFCASGAPAWWCYAVWNKGTSIAKTLTDRYTAVFSPEFLATEGQEHDKGVTVSGYGQFSPLLYLFFVSGLAALLIPQLHNLVKSNNLTRILIVTGLIVSPIPAILVESPQAVRLSALVPFLIITMVFGIKIFTSIISGLFSTSQTVQLLGKLLVPKQVVHIGLTSAIIGVISIQSIAYFSEFFLVYTQKNDMYFNSVVRDVMPVLGQYSQTHEVVIRPFFSDPIMYYAFYNSVHPAEYQQQVRLGELEASGFQHAVGLGRVRISEQPMISIACNALVQQMQPTVYITNEEASDGFRSIAQFYSQNGALVYAYLYDALQYGRAHALECSDLPEQERMRIFTEYQQELATQLN